LTKLSKFFHWRTQQVTGGTLSGLWVQSSNLTEDKISLRIKKLEPSIIIIIIIIIVIETVQNV